MSTPTDERREFLESLERLRRGEVDGERGVAVPAVELAQLRAVIEEALDVLRRSGMVADVGGAAAVR